MTSGAFRCGEDAGQVPRTKEVPPSVSAEARAEVLEEEARTK